jgi:hypothetical protein
MIAVFTGDAAHTRVGALTIASRAAVAGAGLRIDAAAATGDEGGGATIGATTSDADLASGAGRTAAACFIDAAVVVIARGIDAVLIARDGPGGTGVGAAPLHADRGAGDAATATVRRIAALVDTTAAALVMRTGASVCFFARMHAARDEENDDE